MASVSMRAVSCTQCCQWDRRQEVQIFSNMCLGPAAAAAADVITMAQSQALLLRDCYLHVAVFLAGTIISIL